MAPEVLDGQSYDEKVDSYSFAIVMYEILCRIIPYEDTGRSYLLVSMRYSGILFRAATFTNCDGRQQGSEAEHSTSKVVRN